jgi:hypothetical protein
MKTCNCGKQFTKGKILCPACYMKQRYVNNREVLLERQRQAKMANPNQYKQKRRKWREINKERINQQKRDQRSVIRMKCLLHYGNSDPKCNSCGENKHEFLVLDHINGGGKKHGIHDLYVWAHARKYPNILQLLCHNCNFVKSNRGATRSAAKRAKHEVLEHYSSGTPCCSCCGCKDERVLVLDHLFDGAKHRKELGFQGGYRMYLWCRRNGFPEIFQVLCHNCNFAKWAYGICVHAKIARVI